MKKYYFSINQIASLIFLIHSIKLIMKNNYTLNQMAIT